MGAPKQRWSEEEEAALKNGIAKHGAGKWTTILKDPEFRPILCLRSNVDLKDKYRNLCTVRSGEGSREKAITALKKVKLSPVRESNPMALSVNEDTSNEIADIKPLAMSIDTPDLSGRNRRKPKLEALILDAMTNLKEPKGSNITNISAYIEERYENFSDIKHVLAETMKNMLEAGILIKVKHKYRIAQNPDLPTVKGSKILQIEGKQKEILKTENADTENLSNLQIDAGLLRMKGMTSEEAAKEAAQAVAEADVMMAETEAAVRELEAAEAYADASQTFLDLLSLELKKRNIRMMVAGIPS